MSITDEMPEVESPNGGNDLADAGEGKQESAYHAPATQDELNRIIESRLKRERAKYADYDACKEKADKFDKVSEELQELKQRAAEITEKNAALERAAELEAVKTKVSNETGVPANLLTAADEEGLAKQAEEIRAFATRASASPYVGSDGRSGKAAATNAQRFGAMVSAYLNNE